VREAPLDHLERALALQCTDRTVLQVRPGRMCNRPGSVNARSLRSVLSSEYQRKLESAYQAKANPFTAQSRRIGWWTRSSDEKTRWQCGNNRYAVSRPSQGRRTGLHGAIIGNAAAADIFWLDTVPSRCTATLPAKCSGKNIDERRRRCARSATFSPATIYFECVRCEQTEIVRAYADRAYKPDMLVRRMMSTPLH